MSDRVEAPFTPEQVKHLNDFQSCGYLHPFTCGGDGRTDESIHGDREGVLVATVRGWICPYCAYTQEWAHGFMAKSLQPNPMDRITRCGICGGKTVEIRGRYPNDARRRTCPTCATERLDQINAISSRDYGIATQAAIPLETPSERAKG